MSRLLPLFLFIIFISITSAAGQIFQEADAWSLSALPSGIETGDFNKDGRADIAILEYNSWNECTLSIYLNAANNKLTLKERKSYKVAGYSLRTNDLNKDGHLDLVLTMPTQLMLLLGDGQGNFNAAKTKNIRDGYASVVNDFNKDGHLDIATTNFLDQSVMLFTGNGKGGFTENDAYKVGAQPASIESSDVNQDTYPDLVVGNQASGNISLLLNNKQGGFGAAKNYPVGFFPNNLAIAELNGDQYLDIAVVSLNEKESITLLSGDGQGGFTPFQIIPGYIPADILIKDFTCDARPDILISSGGLMLFENSATGFVLKNQATNWHAASSIASADFNLDGGFDVIAPFQRNNVEVALLTNIKDCALYLNKEEDPVDPKQPDITPSKLVSIPNIFTPNGDGQNEFFEIKWSKDIPENELTVYDRWGGLVHSNKHYQNNWNGSQLAEGVYFYIIQVNKSKEVFKGWVTIAR
ncbi:T9SS type B sorting domain-containing protein [Nibribacter ruber]|uniref:T9SS type B sorting domain-containing protein n=1 Tax=Nibribacter ruber TaxID=2698458 RepID=A0A6P1P0L0_9BACT|nr:FG-GAP-like repeat-containing protein [Nibribacter ruber]QHL86512.1 T9SS type B sorting domain-containing protein [Nibribacter ruber]